MLKKFQTSYYVILHANRSEYIGWDRSFYQKGQTVGVFKHQQAVHSQYLLAYSQHLFVILYCAQYK